MIKVSYVTDSDVREGEVALCEKYNQLFRAMPGLVMLYNNGATTAFTIRHQYHLHYGSLLADDDTVRRVLSLHAYFNKVSLPVDLILTDEEFANMFLIGKSLGYIKTEN